MEKKYIALFLNKTKHNAELKLKLKEESNELSKEQGHHYPETALLSDILKERYNNGIKK